MNRIGIIGILSLTLTLGCQSVSDPNQTEDPAATSTKTPESSKAKDASVMVTSQKWQLIQMEGFDQHQSAYQKFTLSFRDQSLSAKAFNTLGIPSVTLEKNGVLKQSGQAVSTKMAVVDTNKVALENTFFSRVKSAKLWRVLRKRLVIGSGKNKLIFIQAQ